MLVKRYYDRPKHWEPLRNVPNAAGVLPNPHRAEGALLNPPPFAGMEIKHTGTSPEQNFSERFVTKGREEGWIGIADGVLTLYGTPENLTYTILRVPGRYSCFDGSKLPDDEADQGTLARAYIAEHHAGALSPDPENPAGYYKINHYECVLDSEQHEKYCLQKGQV